MRIKPESASDAELKCRAVELLAYGILPYEQWAHVFANQNFKDWPGLQAKAFSVWFPTMVDFLQGEDEVLAIEKELTKRKVDTVPLFELIRELATRFKTILTLYSIEEQLFIRDRRLQNVHGRLQIYVFDEHDVPVFHSKTKAITRSKLDAKQYRELMAKFYSDMATNSASLLKRFLQSEEFKSLTELYVSSLKFADHFDPLIKKLGVSAACGSG